MIMTSVIAFVHCWQLGWSGFFRGQTSSRQLVNSVLSALACVPVGLSYVIVPKKPRLYKKFSASSGAKTLFSVYLFACCSLDQLNRNLGYSFSSFHQKDTASWARLYLRHSISSPAMKRAFVLRLSPEARPSSGVRGAH